jgi:hypothetical protein
LFEALLPIVQLQKLVSIIGKLIRSYGINPIEITWGNYSQQDRLTCFSVGKTDDSDQIVCKYIPGWLSIYIRLNKLVYHFISSASPWNTLSGWNNG